ncbi:MAG: hypothetical protein GEU82_04615 [Luteitalea sp.]|nr:hypothetical protein [Luteitalea sp.]
MRRDLIPLGARAQIPAQAQSGYDAADSMNVGTPRSRSIRRLSALCAVSLVMAAACGDSPAVPSNPLRVTSISPTLGSTTGGTPVNISGSGFASDATVTIGGVEATSVAVQGPGGLTAITGARSTAGASDVTVTTGGRSATLTAGFTFVGPPATNQPPVIASIRSIGSRPNQPSAFADIDETITLVATVTDNETPAGSLTYAWSGPGTFTGTGATTVWRVPASITPTPSPVVVTLDVTEPFTEGGVSHTNRSAPGLFTVQVHDSQKEILELGEDFLTLFTRSEVPVGDVLRNFSPTCDQGAGRRNEAGDVERARREHVQDFSKFRIARLPPVTFNFGGACLAFGNPTRVRRSDACSLFSVHWEITYIQNLDANRRIGTRAVTDGRDHVTAVLENNQWRLCHSDFVGTEVIGSRGIVRQVQW